MKITCGDKICSSIVFKKIKKISIFVMFLTKYIETKKHLTDKNESLKNINSECSRRLDE